MISLLLLLAAAQASPPPPPPLPPVKVAEARATLRQAAEARRAVIDAAINSQLLGGGYFQRVTDPAEQAAAAARFQERLRSVGIPASVGGCQWIGLVAAGVANGNRSFGGACSVTMASGGPSDFLICDASLGGVTLIRPEWFASDDLYVEVFIRRTCL